MRGLHIICAPSGKFIFVGSVPTSLAFEVSDPSYADAAVRSGPRIARLIAAKNGGTFRSLSWATYEEARDEAVRQGYEGLLSDSAKVAA
jgi:hypothetical protein